MEKRSLLKETIQHIDIRSFDARPIIEAYGHMAFQARNLTTMSKRITQHPIDEHIAHSLLAQFKGREVDRAA